MDLKEKKLTVIGDIDPVDVVSKLRKIWHTEILAVGPAKEEGKKDEGKKEGEKKNPNEQQMTELMTLTKTTTTTIPTHLSMVTEWYVLRRIQMRVLYVKEITWR
jgi:hypothetical protein